MNDRPLDHNARLIKTTDAYSSYIAQKIFLSYSTRIFLQFCQIAASIVVARVAGPTVLGTVAFCLAYVSMFQFITDLGLGAAHIKLVSEGQDLGKCISTYSRLKFFTIGLYFLVMLSFFFCQKYVFNVSFESAAHQYVIMIFFLMMVLQGFLDIPIRTFAAKTEQAKQNVPEIIRGVFLQLARIAAVLIGFRALGLAFCNFASAVIVAPIIFVLFKHYPFGGYDKKLVKRYLNIALPMVFLGASTILIGNLDKVALQFFYNSEQVGYYTAGFRIGALVQLVGYSVGTLLFPLFSRAAANSDYASILEKIEKIEHITFILLMPIVIFLALYSDSIVLFVLGEQYINSIGVLSIIIVAMFIMVINLPYGNILAGLGYFGLCARIHCVNLAVFGVALIILLHPRFLGLGATGAALALLVSNAFLGICFRIFAKQKLKSLRISKNINFILFGIANVMVFWPFYGFFKEYWGFHFRLIFPFIYFVSTYLAFFAFKLMKKDDLRMLLSMVDFGSMKKYVKSELR